MATTVQTPAAFQQFALPAGKTSLSSLAQQGQTMLDQHSTVSKGANRMLSLFAVILSLALAAVLFMLFAATPVNAMNSLPPFEIAAAKADGLVALAAMGSLGTAFGLGFALIRLHLRPAVGQKKR
jgi:hypothetical protein